MKLLNKTQLQLIAVIAMLCDHIAWCFLEEGSITSAILHILGMISATIMCFFIAEGYRHTSNIRAYLSRLTCFWIVTILPFYAFFKGHYSFRQNIIFDLLLALLVLYISDSKKYQIRQKILLITAILILSVVFSSLPVIAILFVVSFYYGKTFGSQCALMVLSTVAYSALMILVTCILTLTGIGHGYMPWYNYLYILLFTLGLIVLGLYNGKKGKPIVTESFFYIFYPVHFVLLLFIKACMNGFSSQQIYIMIQIVAIVTTFITVAIVLMLKSSRLQVSTILFSICSIVYSFGFLVEITSTTVDGIYSAIKVEYFGECMLIIGLTLFIREVSHRVIYRWIYMVEIVFSCLTMYLIFTTQQNGIFYRSMTLDTSGPFPRISLEYGIGFYTFISYLIAVCIVGIIFIQLEIKHSTGLDKKRLRCLIAAIASAWAPYLIKLTGITCGYEIPSLGIMGAVIFISLAIIKYNYFDSVSLASEYALSHGQEGIIVLDNNYRMQFYNRQARELFGTIDMYTDIRKIPLLNNIVNDNLSRITIGSKVYEMRVNMLIEENYTRGYMIWALDITNHYNELMAIDKKAKIDPLTGLQNRSEFEQRVSVYLDNGGYGAMFMLDLDDFKNVNDRYGHQTGDAVLLHFSDVIKETVGDSYLAGRLGGDEFVMFFRKVTDKATLVNIAENVIKEFAIKLENAGYKGYTTTSIGIAIAPEAKNSYQKSGSDIDFCQLYTRSDKALYLSKNSGKNIYKFF